MAAVSCGPITITGGVMVDPDSPEELARDPSGWLLDRELDVAAEVWDPKARSVRAFPEELSDEALVRRFRIMLGFDLRWESQD
jgi:hypothetical protein